MVSLGSIRRAAQPCASRVRALLCVLFGAILVTIVALSLLAAGLRGGAGLAIEGAALRDCVGGPQVHNYDAPGHPPPRLLDTELRNDDDDGDEDAVLSLADFADQAHELSGPIRSAYAFAERRSPAVQCVHATTVGARGPPRA